MNLTGRSVTPKGQKRKRSNLPTKAHREYWERVRSLGCSVCKASNPEIHHALTGAGRRRDHDKVIPLCRPHHRGEHGIHTLSRKVWQEQFGAEQEHLDRVALLLR
ncbi:Ref family recombination enhancement nuclease [Zavarzinella formosa]|uniref:Ref family recombination enhancement nuclease n=1 Tax=Zavarzinella formosa TaxID=360055 RepID=UPI0036F391A8